MIKISLSRLKSEFRKKNYQSNLKLKIARKKNYKIRKNIYKKIDNKKELNK